MVHGFLLASPNGPTTKTAHTTRHMRSMELDVGKDSS
jgi:hypothetical protein